MRQSVAAVFLIAAISLTGCGKDDGNPEGTSVYVAGSIGGKVVLWVNGKAEYLEGGTSARSVFVSGNNVSVAGVDGAYSTEKVILQKNGVQQELSLDQDREEYSALESTRANSVYVYRGDALVTGQVRKQGEGRIPIFYSAALWKNAVLDVLIDGAYNQTETEAAFVFVLGNDVYTAHNNAEQWTGNTSMAIMGRKQNDPDYIVHYTRAERAFAAYSFVSDSDMYAVGCHYSINPEGSLLQKNNVVQSLSGGTGARSIYVSGNNVYIAGQSGASATMWVNGEAQPTHRRNHPFVCLFRFRKINIHDSAARRATGIPPNGG